MKYLKISEYGPLESVLEATTPEEAFEKTIEKWTAILKNKGLANTRHAGGQRSTCGLCDVYYVHNVRISKDCAGCPIKLDTGYSHCMKSPFDAWQGNPCEETAKAELKYLQKLYKRWKEER